MLAKSVRSPAFKWARSLSSAAPAQPVANPAAKRSLLVVAAAGASLASLYYYSEQKVRPPLPQSLIDIISVLLADDISLRITESESRTEGRSPGP